MRWYVLRAYISVLNKDFAHVQSHVSKKNLTEEERQRRILQLKEWGFSVDNYQKETEFLVAHFEGCEEMVKTTGKNASYIFRFGLPAVARAGLVNERYWLGLVEMIKEAGENAHKT